MSFVLSQSSVVHRVTIYLLSKRGHGAMLFSSRSDVPNVANLRRVVFLFSFYLLIVVVPILDRALSTTVFNIIYRLSGRR